MCAGMKPTARRGPDAEGFGWSRLAALLVLALTVVLASAPAEARTRVFVGVGLGIAPWPYYYAPPPYYYPPPVYYAPPVIHYLPPPPLYYTPLPPPAPARAPRCRQFNGDAVHDQSGAPFYGTACLWPDGRWHVVN